MPWPTGQDYNEAIQNPAVSFEDPDLRSGTPELTALGLPRPITGGFASVYRMQSGGKSWAVRCFLREFSDHQERYTAISNHLAARPLPYTVQFQFLPRGIRISGRWFPILKMEWVKGQLLSQYVETCVGSPQKLVSLARNWLEMVKALSDAGIAHGDLQHGNVVVADGALRLIDYDGMFVPALAGRMSNEVGHRNYQHPLRTPADFGSFTDNFSAWTIYTSLLVMSCDPTLMKRFGGGDEYLIFQKCDFTDPANSTAFATLESHRDPRVSQVAGLFKSLLYLSPTQIPNVTARDSSFFAAPPTSLPPPLANNWLDDHLQTDARNRGPSNAVPPEPTSDASWLFDYVTAPNAQQSRVFSVSTAARICPLFLLITGGALTILIPAWSSLAAFLTWQGLGVLVTANACSLWLLYWTRPEVVDAREARQEHIKQREVLQTVERSLAKVNAASSKTVEAIQKKRLAVEKRGNQAKTDEAKDVAARDAQLRKALAEINTKRLAVNQAEAAALRRAGEESAPIISQINRQISELTQQRASESSGLLQASQAAYFANHLTRYRLASASIHGIGPSLTARLAARGIHTAADIQYGKVVSVSGIGSSKAHALMHWRDSLMGRLRSGMPTALSTVDENNLRQKYDSRRVQLESNRAAAERRAIDTEKVIREKHNVARFALNADEQNEIARAQHDKKEIEKKYTSPRTQIASELRDLAEVEHKERALVERSKASLHKEIFGARWRLSEAAAGLVPFKKITFGNYIKTVVAS